MAIYISKQSGNWSDASTWHTVTNLGDVPVDAVNAPQSEGNDKIIIANNAIVVYDVNGVFGDGSSVYPTALDASNLSANAIVLSSGMLSASRSTSTSLTVNGTIAINSTNSPWFNWGTTGDPISAVNANLTFGTSAQNTSLKYGIFGRNSTAAENGIDSSKITIVGKAKTRNTYLITSHSTSTSSLSVSNCDGWQIGDKLVVEVPVLSSTVLANTIGNITNIDGNIITIDSTLNRNCPSGTYVGNFSSNITLRPGMSAIAANGNANAFGIQFNLNGNDSFYEFKNLSLTDFNGVVGGGAIFNIGATYGRREVVFDNLSFFLPGTQTVEGFDWGGGIGYPHSIKNVAFYSTNGNSHFAVLGIAANMTISDSVVYRAGYMGTMTNSLDVSWKNIRSFSTNQGLGGQVYSFRANFDNCYIRTNANNPHIFGLSYYTQKYTLNNCYFQTLNTSNNPANLVNASEASTGVLEFRNCTLSSVNLPVGGLTSAKTLAVNHYSLSGNPLDNRRVNSFYSLSGNYSMRNRGIASYELVSLKQNTQHYFTETIAAKANVSQRFIGYLRYQASYGSTNLPYITFTDDNKTSSVTQVFSCAPVSDTWQKFDITVNPVTDGNLTMTVYSQTSSTSARVYLDGMSFDPINPKSRHYGFQFNETFANQTINTLTTLTENQVSSLSTIRHLDDLYDASTYWSVTNPGATSYVDLVTAVGDVLDFGSTNLILNNYGSAYAYNSASNTISINTQNLSSGTKFTTLITTGNVALNSGIISNINIQANIIQDTPTDLTGVVMQGSSTLVFNTNLARSLTYTNCIILSASNTGSGIITIKKTNSSVTESDDEIVIYEPTFVHLSLNGGYIAIYDHNNVLYQYGTYSNDSTLELPASATGTWTYKVARYGFEFIQGNFSVNGGGDIYITPSYIADDFITASVEVVSAYDDLNTTAKIHDYISYYRTTSAGIGFGELHTQSFGTLTFNTGLTLINKTTTPVLSVANNVMYINCSEVSDDIVYFIDGDFTQLSGNTISDDLRIRANNLNSEIVFTNIDSFVIYPSLTARDSNTNIAITGTESIYRYLYGSSVSGVLFQDYIYMRVTIDPSTLLISNAISQGTTEIDFGTVGNLQTILSNQRIINQGVQKASKLIPHTENI